MVWFSSLMQSHCLPNTSIDRCNHHSFADSQRPGNVSGFIPDDGSSRWSGCCGLLCKLHVLKEAKPFVPHKIFMSLQAVMNTAARLIYGRSSSDHITPLLMDLHWLRIPDRSTFKIILIVYRAATGSAPQHLNDELLTNTSAISGRASIRSRNNRTLVVPRSRAVRQGDRSFHVCGPMIWNSLPNRSPCCTGNRTF